MVVREVLKPKAFAQALVADASFKKDPNTGKLLGLTPAAISDLLGAQAKRMNKEVTGLNNLVN